MAVETAGPSLEEIGADEEEKIVDVEPAPQPDVTGVSENNPPVKNVEDPEKPTDQPQQPEEVEATQRNTELMALIGQFAALSGGSGGELNPDLGLDQYTAGGKREMRRQEFRRAGRNSAMITGAFAVGTAATVGAVAALPVLVGGAIGFGVSQLARKGFEWFKGRKRSGGMATTEVTAQADQGKSWREIEDELGEKIYRAESAALKELSAIAKEILGVGENSPEEGSPEQAALKLKFIQKLIEFQQVQEQLAPEKQRHHELVRKSNRWKTGLGVSAALLGGGLYAYQHAMHEAAKGIMMHAHNGLGETVNNAVPGLPHVSERLVNLHGGQVVFHYDGGGEYQMLQAAAEKIPNFLTTPAARALFEQGTHIGGKELATEFWKQLLAHNVRELGPAMLALFGSALIASPALSSRGPGRTGVRDARGLAAGLSGDFKELGNEAETERIEAHLRRNPALRPIWEKYHGQVIKAQAGPHKDHGFRLTNISDDSEAFVFEPVTPGDPEFEAAPGEDFDAVFGSNPEPYVAPSLSEETPLPKPEDPKSGDIFIDKDGTLLKVINGEKDDEGNERVVFQVVDKDGNPIDGAEPRKMTLEEIADAGLRRPDVGTGVESELNRRLAEEFKIDDIMTDGDIYRKVVATEGTGHDRIITFQLCDEDGNLLGGDDPLKMKASDARRGMYLHEKAESDEEVAEPASGVVGGGAEETTEPRPEGEDTDSAPARGETDESGGVENEDVAELSPEQRVQKLVEFLRDVPGGMRVVKTLHGGFRVTKWVQPPDAEVQAKKAELDIPEVSSDGFQRIPTGSEAAIRLRTDSDSLEFDDGMPILDFDVLAFDRDSRLIRDNKYQRAGYFPEVVEGETFDSKRFEDELRLDRTVVVRDAKGQLWNVVGDGVNAADGKLMVAPLDADTLEPLATAPTREMNIDELSDWYVGMSTDVRKPQNSSEQEVADQAKRDASELSPGERESLMTAVSDTDDEVQTGRGDTVRRPVSQSSNVIKPGSAEAANVRPHEWEKFDDSDQERGDQTLSPDFERIGDGVRLKLQTGERVDLAPGGVIVFRVPGAAHPSRHIIDAIINIPARLNPNTKIQFTLKGVFDGASLKVFTESLGSLSKNLLPGDIRSEPIRKNVNGATEEENNA